MRRTVGPDIAVEVVGAAGLWTARVDAVQLENALLNLCINARDAMPGRRQAHDRDRQQVARRPRRARARPAARAVRLALRHRHRHGHDARRDRARLRSLLHHQADGPGHRPRPVDDLRLRAPVGRPGAHLFGGRQGHDHVPLPARASTARPMAESDTAAASRSTRGYGETVLVVDDEPTVRMLIVEVLTENRLSPARGAVDGPSALKILAVGQRASTCWSPMSACPAA